MSNALAVTTFSTPQARHSPAMSTGSMVPLESVLERPGLS